MTPYDDLSALLRSATLDLSPSADAAGRALSAARVQRRRDLVLSGAGGLALAGVAVGGVAVLASGRGAAPRPRIAAAAAYPSAAQAVSASPSTEASPAPAGKVQPTPAGRRTTAPVCSQFVEQKGSTTPPSTDLMALSAPDTLPGYPHRGPWSAVHDTAIPTDGELTIDPGLTDSRLWGWDAAPYLTHGAEGDPGGPQLRVTAYDAPDCHASRVVTGTREVLGRSGSLSHDTDDAYLDVTVGDLTLEAQGVNGATTDDLVAAIESLQGLPSDPSASPTS